MSQPSGSASEPTPPLAIDKAVRDVVTEGRVVFNPATNIRQGHSERVEVAIARSTNLDQELLPSLRSTTNAQVKTIATSPFMGLICGAPDSTSLRWPNENSCFTRPRDGSSTCCRDAAARDD